jgi:hypothetical protein
MRDLTLPLWQPFNLQVVLYKPSVILDLTCKTPPKPNFKIQSRIRLIRKILHVRRKTPSKPRFKIQSQIHQTTKIMLQLSDRIAELVSPAHVGIVNSFSISNQEIKLAGWQLFAWIRWLEKKPGVREGFLVHVGMHTGGVWEGFLVHVCMHIWIARCSCSWPIVISKDMSAPTLFAP